jgi:hypothetical protein
MVAPGGINQRSGDERISSNSYLYMDTRLQVMRERMTVLVGSHWASASGCVCR